MAIVITGGVNLFFSFTSVDYDIFTGVITFNVISGGLGVFLSCCGDALYAVFLGIKIDDSATGYENTSSGLELFVSVAPLCLAIGSFLTNDKEEFLRSIA